MIKLINKKIALGLICLAVPFTSFADYEISPIKLKIDSKTKVASLKFRNNGDKAGKFQITVLKKTMMDGKESYDKTDDLIATPFTFNVDPKKTQLIRIAANSVGAHSENDDYRVQVTELQEGPMQPNSVRLLTSVNVPVAVDNK